METSLQPSPLPLLPVKLSLVAEEQVIRGCKDKKGALAAWDPEPRVKDIVPFWRVAVSERREAEHKIHGDIAIPCAH